MGLLTNPMGTSALRDLPRPVKSVALIAGTYVALLGISRLVLRWPAVDQLEAQQKMPAESLPIFLLSFVVFFLPLLYLVPRLLAGQPLRIKLPALVSTMGVTFCCAILIEVLVDSAFTLLTGKPCWEYRVWPAHGGYTSRSAPILWSLYGFFLYCLHQAIRLRPCLSGLRGDLARGILLAADAMVLEVAANIFTLWTFGAYYFYYLPTDLAHLTTGAIFVPYAVAGVVGMKVLSWLEGQSAGYGWGVGCYVAGIVFLAYLA